MRAVFTLESVRYPRTRGPIRLMMSPMMPRTTSTSTRVKPPCRCRFRADGIGTGRSPIAIMHVSLRPRTRSNTFARTTVILDMMKLLAFRATGVLCIGTHTEALRMHIGHEVLDISLAQTEPRHLDRP